MRGLTPPNLKQKAHKRQIEHPGDTWQDLQDYVINRDLCKSYTVSSEYACAGSSNFDNQSEIQALKNQLTELTNLMKENKINATYDPNQPRNRQNHTRFCNYCKRSGHTIAYCFEKKRHDEQNRQPPSYRDKFTDNYRRSQSNEYNRQNTPQQNSRGRARDFISSNNKNNDYNNSPKFYHNPARSPSNYSMQRYPDSYNQNRVAQNADTRSRSRSFEPKNRSHENYRDNSRERYRSEYNRVQNPAYSRQNSNNSRSPSRDRKTVHFPPERAQVQDLSRNEFNLN